MKRQLPKLCRKIAIKTLMENKVQSMSILSAIVLTTVLLMSTFSTYYYMNESIQMAMMEQTAWKGHMLLVDVTDEQYTLLEAHESVGEIGHYEHLGFLVDGALNEVVEVQYADSIMAEWLFYEVVQGKMPSTYDEIVLSDAYFKGKEMDFTPDMPLTLSLEVNGEVVTQAFKVTGVYNKNASSAEVALVSKVYYDSEVNRVGDRPLKDSMFGKKIVQIKFSKADEIDQQAIKLVEGLSLNSDKWTLNRAYLNEERREPTFVFGMFAIVALILLSSFLIIYNIFNIASTRNLRHYGSLLTIGVEGDQISKMVFLQVNILCAVGVPIGLALGSLFSIKIVPDVVRFISDEISIGVPSPIVFVVSAVVSYLAVTIAAYKPVTKLSKLSPIRDKRFYVVQHPKKNSQKGYKLHWMAFKHINRRKAVIICASLSVCVIMATLFYSIIQGLSMTSFLSMSLKADYIVGEKSYFNSINPTPKEIPSTALDEIQSWSGIEKSGGASMVTVPFKLEGANYELFRALFPEEYAKFGDESILNVVGFDDFVLDKVEILDGTFDLQAFKTGDYLLVNRFVYPSDKSYYEPGDKVSTQLGEGREKTYTVMAVIEAPAAFSPRVRTEGVIEAFLPRSEWVNQFGQEGYYVYGFDVENEAEARWHANLENMTGSDSTIGVESKENFVKQFESFFGVIKVIGIFASTLLGVIGVLNFINVIHASVYERRYELAVMRSMGMSMTKIYGLLILEAAYHMLLAAVTSLAVGIPVIFFITHLIENAIPFFQMNLSLEPMGLFIILGTVLSLVTPSLCYYNIERSENFLSRLRNAES